MNAKHFAGLDGLRFISIFFVVLHHLFTFKRNFGFREFDAPVVGIIGFYGIQFFFMGSGFLITYLLLYEYRENGKINFKNFFLRRILRIWPAYYLLIAFFLCVFKQSFFKIPGTTDQYLGVDYITSNCLYLLFLPHIQPFLFPTAPFVHHTYTIGIEEQFYILWGVLFYFFRRYLLSILLFILIAMPFLNLMHELAYNYINQDADAPRSLRYLTGMVTYLKYSRFSTFAIGSIFGYTYFQKPGWINTFKNRKVQVLLYSILFLSVFYNIQPKFFEYEYIALLMACLMLTATFKKDSLINFSTSWISYLGRISYGIYLFHIFAIVFACKISAFFFEQEKNWIITLALCLLTLALSVLFGEISYRFFERYFLKLKERFKNSSTNETSITR